LVPGNDVGADDAEGDAEAVGHRQDVGDVLTGALFSATKKNFVRGQCCVRIAIFSPIFGEIIFTNDNIDPLL
jgi:hypothetical protein